MFWNFEVDCLVKCLLESKGISMISDKFFFAINNFFITIISTRSYASLNFTLLIRHFQSIPIDFRFNPLNMHFSTVHFAYQNISSCS